MNNTVSVSDFLDFIDPDKKIDREKTTADLGLVVISEGIKSIYNLLSDVEKQEIERILGTEEPNRMSQVVTYIKSIGRGEEYDRVIEEKKPIVAEDCIKHLFWGLDKEKRAAVLVRFPQLGKNI